MLSRVASSKEDFNYVALLKSCAQNKDLCKGTRIHADVVKRGFLERVPYLSTTLINMYAKCGAIEKAQQILEELPVRNSFIWSALIGGYTQQRQDHEALHCFERMQSEGMSPDAVTYTCALKA